MKAVKVHKMMLSRVSLSRSKPSPDCGTGNNVEMDSMEIGDFMNALLVKKVEKFKPLVKK